MNQMMTRAVSRGMLALLLVLGAVAVPLAQATASSRGFIWKVEKAGRTGWLVGSLHMLRPDAYPLPSSLTDAFSAADTLMEEADPEELASPAFAASVVGRAMYTDGQTLENHVSADTFRLIAERATVAGLPVEVINRMKPWMVATTLQAFELKRGGFDPGLGLDLHFHGLALQSSKRFLALETGIEQIGFLENLGPQFEDALVRANLQAAETEVNEVKQIESAWRTGDAASLERLLLDDLKDAPAIYETLIVSRNRAWLPKVRSCFDTSRCFVVVGAGHLVGPDGLINVLRTEGYQITQQ